MKKKISDESISWKTKLVLISAYCFPVMFLLGVYLMIAWKDGNRTVPLLLVNFGENAFLIFTTILTIFKLQLVFPTLFELSLDLQLFENFKYFL